MKDIKIGSFNSVKDFAFYTESHYLPLIERLSGRNTDVSEDDRRLLGFLLDDLKSFVSNFNE